ncbi:MAG: hypothetical protein ACRDOJ_11750 [Nocardioidaceae bacterium]
MNDRLAVEIQDPAVLAEIEMATDLMIAASESESRLPQSVIDRILGVPALPAAS